MNWPLLGYVALAAGLCVVASIHSTSSDRGTRFLGWLLWMAAIGNILQAVRKLP